MIYIKLLSLFSGIDSFERSLTNIGVNYNLIGYSEINKWASTAYSAIHNVSEKLNYGDVSKIDFTQFNEVDMITHGSSCQDFSISGKQQGGNEGSGTRSSLMWHTVEAIRETNPKYVIWENVDNVLSDKHKHNFDKYRKRLRKLGYDNYYKVINAKHWGVPQNRNRIFVVSIRKDINHNFKFPISNLENNGQKSLFHEKMINIEPKILKNVLQEEVDEKYYLDIDINLEKNKDILTATFGGRYNVQKDNVLLELNQIGGVNDGKFNTKGTYGQGQRVYADNGLASTIRGEGGGQGGKIGLYLTNYRIRKLTPLECFKLMGFNDKDYRRARTALETTYYNGKDRSDSQMYRMAGNSIVVPILEYIFKELLF